LGLLARQPMAGYDVKRFLRSLSWLIDSPSFGTLYPTLHGLLEDGLVTVEQVPSQDRPTRKIYTITEAGRRVLRQWMNQPNVSQRSLKAFLMRLALASHLSHSDLRAYLEQRRAQVTAHQLDLEQAVKLVDEGTDLGERLTIEYGLVLAAAELSWLDRTLARLSQISRSVETAVQSSGAALTV
jgi:PadR family transcriptional regulator AphA